MKYLLDTNVISEFRKEYPDTNVIDWLAKVDEERTLISVITVAELRRGVALLKDGQRKALLAAWVDKVLADRFDGRILDVTQPVAARWGLIMANAKQSGLALDFMDGFLAATAQVHSLCVVTRNVRDFQQLDLMIVNPWLSSGAGS